MRGLFGGTRLLSLREQIRYCFGPIVAYGETPRSKPHPDPYVSFLSPLCCWLLSPCFDRFRGSLQPDILT
jgi:hypothetical protein